MNWFFKLLALVFISLSSGVIKAAKERPFIIYFKERKTLAFKVKDHLREKFEIPVFLLAIKKYKTKDCPINLSQILVICVDQESLNKVVWFHRKEFFPAYEILGKKKVGL